MRRTLLLTVFVISSLVLSSFAMAGAQEAPAEPQVIETQSIDTDVNTTRVGLVDPATGIWFLRGQNGVVGSFFYGDPGDVPFVGDWNCDGIDTPGLYRQSDGFVYLRNSNSQGVADIRFFFGNPGDYPLAGDFNDDGCDTVSIYRASEARIYVINALGANDGGLGAADFSYIFGNPGDKPFVADFDGDGVDTVGLHRESTGFVYYRDSLTQGVADEDFFFGDPGDRFVAGDWGIVDGEETPGLFRPSNATFFFRHTNSQGNADQSLVWGTSTYLPIAGNWGTVTPGGPGGGGGGTPPALAVSGSLPSARQNMAYSANLTVTGGTPGYKVQILTVPSWASVTVSGSTIRVFGTAPASGGSGNVQVRVTDAKGAQVLRSVPLTVIGQCSGIGLPTQCPTLAQLYNATNGNSWTERTGWFTTANPCEWFGIDCTAGDAGNVSVISLDDNHLVGDISAVVFTPLTSLEVFDINANLQVGGTLPASLLGLPNLTTVDVGQNEFVNDIPASLWASTNLSVLDLSDNGFTGPLPDIASNVIVAIDISENGFDGPIPDGLWTKATLTSFDVAGNAFDGQIPATIAGMNALVSIDLSDNDFTGLIPDAMRAGLIDTVTSLAIHGNECFTPETPALDAWLQSFYVLPATWNEAGLCP